MGLYALKQQRKQLPDAQRSGCCDGGRRSEGRGRRQAGRAAYGAQWGRMPGRQALQQQRKCPRRSEVVTKLGRKQPSGNENTSSLG